MRLRIFFVHEVRVIGRNDLHAVLAGQVDENRVDLFLALIDLYIRTGFLGLMALELDIIVLAKEILEPLYGLFRFAEIPTFGDSIEDFLG